MATKDIHEEIPKWKNVDNLIGWKKFQYSHLFRYVCWLAGIFLAIFILIYKGKEGLGVGILLYIILLGVLTLALIWMLNKINLGYKEANYNIEYLYRKKDGQKV